MEAGSELAGKTLREAQFRERFEAIVVALMDGVTRDMTFNPGPAEVIKKRDILIVMGSNEMISRLRSEGCSA